MGHHVPRLVAEDRCQALVVLGDRQDAGVDDDAPTGDGGGIHRSGGVDDHVVPAVGVSQARGPDHVLGHALDPGVGRGVLPFRQEAPLLRFLLAELLKSLHPDLRLLLLGDEAQLRPTRDRDRRAGLKELCGRPDQKAQARPQEGSARYAPALKVILCRRLDGNVNRADVLVSVPVRRTPPAHVNFSRSGPRLYSAFRIRHSAFRLTIRLDGALLYFTRQPPLRKATPIAVAPENFQLTLLLPGAYHGPQFGP